LNWKSGIKMFFTNLACSTQRKERLHGDSIRQFCSDSENDDFHIQPSPRSFDVEVKEVGKKAGAQKISKKRERYFGSHALVFCSFETFPRSMAGGGKNITGCRGQFSNT